MASTGPPVAAASLRFSLPRFAPLTHEEQAALSSDVVVHSNFVVAVGWRVQC